jgi:NAD(P)-dependent dehydrogenase (short-subunit alcohol dehydrogenase family)
LSATPAKVAVVTGSAGGIGQAITAKLEHRGHRVIGLDRSGCRPYTWDRQVDMADTGSLQSLADEIAAECEVEALIHNAAVQPIGAVGETSIADWIEALRVNVIAADVLAGTFRRSMAAHAGAVVVVSSVHARATTGGITAYATTKAALEGWVRSAALDLGPDVRVNAIAPGAVDTAKLREGFDRWGPDIAVERRQVLRERTALGRIAEPAEIAEVVDFLLGPQAAFMTGSVLTIDGGASARLGSE